MNKNNKSISHTPRYAAMEILTKVEKQASYSNAELDNVLKEEAFSPQDAGLVTELVYGVIQRKLTLDYFLQPYLKKSSKTEEWVRQLLRISVYQLAFLDKIPAHAAVNEAVEIAKQKGHTGTAKFVNAVLRNIIRDGFRSFEEIKDPDERTSIEFSSPLWLVKKFNQDIGHEEARNLFASLLDRSKVSVRVNTAVISVEDAQKELEREGYVMHASKVSPSGLVSETGRLASSDLFKRGGITIQDETSMLVAPALQVESDFQVLDACAAPGGKTTHLATYLSPKEEGNVTALDLHSNKLRLIEQNAQRLHVQDRVKTKALDARLVPECFQKESFDRILVDAPCSGLGLMRRKPDIKYAKSQEDILRLSAIQLDILNSVASVLKQGGLMVYSTCTITKEENKEVVASFLKEHQDFEQLTVSAPFLTEKDRQGKAVQIYPQNHGTDGFFIACLRKKIKTEKLNQRKE